MEVELLQTIEQGVIRTLEEEVARHREEATRGAASGFRNHLTAIRDALELDDRPGQLGPVVGRLLVVDAPQEQLAGLAEVEGLLPTLVRQALDQAEADHRHYTKAIGRPGATARQVAVWDEECRVLEARIEKLNRLLVPYEQQVELAAKEYQDALARLNAARLALGQSNNRAKGAVVARFFSRIVVRPPCTEKGSDRDKGRFAFHLSFDEASLKIDVNTGTVTLHALRNRCPSPLSSVAHGSPCMG